MSDLLPTLCLLFLRHPPLQFQQESLPKLPLLQERPLSKPRPFCRRGCFPPDSRLSLPLRHCSPL